MKDNRDTYPIKKACEILNVTRAGYYAFLKRRKSKTKIENEALEGFISQIFEEHSGRYGSNRIVRELAKTGIKTSRCRVSRIMVTLGLRAKGGPKPYGSRRSSSYEERSNIIDRVFSASEKNKVWVGDITYVSTKQGFLYLAVFIDIYSRKIVGWSMSNRINENLSISALDQAMGNESPSGGLIIHTDRGSQYTSKTFQKRLFEQGFVQSMSRKGNPYDNAVSESFYRTLKRELIDGKKYDSRDQAQQDIFKYIELYYNTKRMHSALGYKSPVEFEHQRGPKDHNSVSTKS